jgi:hypothetical protein
MAYLWRALDGAGANASFKSGVANLRSSDWGTLVDNITALPADQIWRHNQAGDLPHDGEVIDIVKMAALTAANSGKRGFTYTHHDPAIGSNAATIAAANAGGFTVNLSANNLEHADRLADLEIGPVVAVLPASVHGKQDIRTPAGRRVVVCPATYREDVSCVTCGLCQVAKRSSIVGFPAHGARKAAASKIAQ